MLFCTSDTVSLSCFITAWPLSESTLNVDVGAGMMMKATTVIGELSCFMRWLSPNHKDER